ncbi:MAG TPA: hypothetical protein ENG63_04025 [Candidatus Desulfofervidus auxilii]|uniref:T4 RNA ligase 1-like N-terminal domain-containing protein n=1 Tax=Desulfofervidus auxilii TaxID=1621989 RepID=A0A7C0U2J1_DESA2|nr:hypothetical protein [Candidatus Desulfofervidus auxilii]
MKFLYPDKLEFLVLTGYISKKAHPKYNDLFIYNYTKKTHYEQNWNYITIQARGLVLDKSYNIIAKPFNKFFYLDSPETQIQLEKLAKIKDINLKKYYITKKYDGCLIIVFKYNNEIIVTTRGQFDTNYAKFAYDFIYHLGIDKYIEKNKTYLFELIGPIFPHIVKYGENDLKLLAINEIKDNEIIEINLYDKKIRKELEAKKFNLVEYYEKLTIKEAKEILEATEPENFEGFVIHFPYFNNLRIKLKSNKFKEEEKNLVKYIKYEQFS